MIIRRTPGAGRVRSKVPKLLSYLGSIMSLLISFRGPRRRQILLPAKGGRRPTAAGPMSGRASGELRITRQARWIVTLELLETSLRLSWSPLGVPETSREPQNLMPRACPMQI